MLRVFASLLVALSLLAAPAQVLASQSAMTSGMAGTAMSDMHQGQKQGQHQGMEHAAQGQPCSTDMCDQPSPAQCAIACLGLLPALADSRAIVTLAVVNPHWPHAHAQSATGQQPSLPEQPPRHHIL